MSGRTTVRNAVQTSSSGVREPLEIVVRPKGRHPGMIIINGRSQALGHHTRSERTMSTPTPTPSVPPPGGAPRSATGSGPRAWRRSMLGTCLAVAGVVLAVAAWSGPSSERDASTLRPTERVDHIDLEIESGTIEIVKGAEVVVDVASRTVDPDSGFTMDSDLTDGRLEVEVSCSRLALLGGCETAVRLVVPPATPVVATAEAGTITATGLTQGVDLRTTAGAIDVEDIEGTIRLRSDAGALRGSVLDGSIDAATSAGHIDITVVNELARLQAITEVGQIDLVVPDADYRIDVGTTLGRTDVQLEDTVGASRTIDARSELGNVTIRRGAATRSTD